MINIKFQTDQSGANNNVCSGSDIIFNFSITDTYNVVGAYISLKKSSGTTASISALIYNASNGGGSLVASSTVLASSITQSYDIIPFLFSNITLSTGSSYSLVLRSTTSCVGSNPYSMKSGNFEILNSDTNTIINTGYGVSSNLNSLCSFTSSATLTKGQKIYLNNNKSIKFRLGSKLPKIYKGNVLIYNPN